MSPIDTHTVTIAGIELETRTGLNTLIDGSNERMARLQAMVKEKYSEVQELNAEMNKVLEGGREAERKLQKDRQLSEQLSATMDVDIATGKRDHDFCWLQIQVLEKTGRLLALLESGREKIRKEYSEHTANLKADIDQIQLTIRQQAITGNYATGMLNLFDFVRENQNHKGAALGTYMKMPDTTQQVLSDANQINRSEIARSTIDFMKMCLHRNPAAHQNGPSATRATIALSGAGADNWPEIGTLD